MKFKIFFMGRFLTHGGVYPFYNVTIFRNGFGRYEDRAMGEHIVVNSGSTAMLSNDCLHYDFKSLDAWIDKHNKYAIREVDDYYAVRSANSELANLYGEAEKAKTLRDGLYYRLPKFLGLTCISFTVITSSSDFSMVNPERFMHFSRHIGIGILLMQSCMSVK